MAIVERVLTIDSVCTALTGIFLFFAPHVVADFVFSRTSDGVHWHLVRCVGGQLFAAAFVTFRFRNGARTAHTVCFILRIIACILLLLLIFQTRSLHPTLVHPLVIKGGLYLLSGSLALYIVFIVGTGWHIGDTLLKGKRIANVLYQLDSIASVCIGVAWLTFPAWLLHLNLDASHELCGRVMGVLFVASHVVNEHALHWSSHTDRRIAIDARVACCVAILSAQIWSQVAYERDWGGGHWVGISLFSTWTVIALIYRFYLWITSSKNKTQ